MRGVGTIIWCQILQLFSHHQVFTLGIIFEIIQNKLTFKKFFKNKIGKVYVKKILSQFDPRLSGPQHFYFKGIFPEAEEAIEEYVGESTQFC